MNRAFAVVLALLLSPAIKAQFVGAAAPTQFKDTSMLRPPAGSKAALIVFEDLGCPACARAHPVEEEVVAQTHINLVRYDFPIQSHVWTLQGAVNARYIQKTLGPEAAAAFRDEVFRSQRQIASTDDINRFTETWLKQHGKSMPFVMDPDGSLTKAVKADYAVGERLNLEFTPTIVVATHDEFQVVCGGKDGACDESKIMPIVQAAMKQAAQKPAAAHKAGMHPAGTN